MNNEDLYIAIGKTDHELLEASEKARGRRRLPVYFRVLAAAAALFLIISAVSALNIVRISGGRKTGGAFLPAADKAAEAPGHMEYDGDAADKEISGETAAARNEAGETNAPAVETGAPAAGEDLLQGVIPASTKSVMTSGRIALISLASAGVLILTAVILFVNGRKGKRDKRSDL